MKKEAVSFYRGSLFLFGEELVVTVFCENS